MEEQERLNVALKSSLEPLYSQVSNPCLATLSNIFEVGILGGLAEIQFQATESGIFREVMF